MASLIGLQCVGGESPFYKKEDPKAFSCSNYADTGYVIYYGKGPTDTPCYCQAGLKK